MSRHYPRGAGRRHGLLRGGLIAAGAATVLLTAAAPAMADSSRTYIKEVLTPVIEIESDGNAYTKPANGQPAVAARANVLVSADYLGRVKSFKVWLKFHTQNSDWVQFPQHGKSAGFPFGDRPKTVSVDEVVSIPSSSYASHLVGYCNQQADALRQSGLSNQEIFSQDREVKAGIHSALQYEMTGPNGFSVTATYGSGDGWDYIKKMTVVCKGAPPRAPAPVADNGPARDKPEVLEADLTVIEGHSLRGACSVNLSGVIRTSEPNTQVKFRYRSAEGQESDLKTVTTDHTAMAMFSHAYPLSSGGVKNGKVRIVGTSSSFASHWQEYEVDCGSPAQGYAAGDPLPSGSGLEPAETRPGGSTIGRLARQQAQAFAIQAPQGLVRKGEIRLSGGAANGKYKLTFLRKNGGSYVAVNAAQLPKQMTGLAASFPLKALTGGRDWRLEVCPDGGQPGACKTADFRLTRIGGAGAANAPAPAPEQPQSTIFLLPGVGQ